MHGRHSLSDVLIWPTRSCPLPWMKYQDGNPVGKSRMIPQSWRRIPESCEVCRLIGTNEKQKKRPKIEMTNN